jgi:microcystin-dependent protein
VTAVGQRYYTPNPEGIDQNGVPWAGSRLFFYLTGTNTPLNTWQDPGMTTPNPNPVEANTNGYFGNIFLSPSQAYHIQFWSPATADNPTGVLIWDADPCGPAAGGTIANTAGIVGEVRQFAGPSAAVPSGWYLCAGQAFSRTTFSGLFSVIGTTWGAGDGSTTFNLPDLRGRAMFGQDNMGGTPAGRLTAGVSGVPGTTIGGVGGDQSTQAHNHGLNDPSHTHAVVDPGHVHQLTVANSPTGGGGHGVDATTTASGTNPNLGLIIVGFTGISLDNADTGITLSPYGTGAAQNVPPAAVVNMIIYAGA